MLVCMTHVQLAVDSQIRVTENKRLKRCFLEKRREKNFTQELGRL